MIIFKNNIDLDICIHKEFNLVMFYVLISTKYTFFYQFGVIVVMIDVLYIIIGPPYDPINLRIIPIFYLYLFLFPVSILMAVKLIIKGYHQQSKPAKILGLSFMSFGLGIIIAFIGLLEVMITQEFREIYRWSLPIGYSMGALGNVFLLYFGYSLFENKKRKLFIFELWMLFTLIIINLDNNWYGVPHSSYTGQFSWRVISSVDLTLFSFVICIFLYYKMKGIKTSDKVKSVGFRMIKWSFISFILFWVCMSLDALNIIITGDGFSIFILIGWIFALFFWFLSYIGLLMPLKLRRILENKISSSNEKVQK